MLHTIRQNNAIDIYNDYFPEPSATATLEPPSARMVNVFRDPNEIPRSAVRCVVVQGTAEVSPI